MVKVIYLGFSFLKKQKELVITTSTRFATAKIVDTTIHEVLSIDES